VTAGTEVVVSRRALRRALLGATTLTIALGFIVELLKDSLSLSERRGLLPLLSLSYEANAPTCYAAALLSMAAILLALRAAAARAGGERFVRHWWGLSLGFAYIAFDEIVQIHEAANWLDLRGIFYFSWIVPAAALLVVLALVYAPFVLRLPPETRRRFVVAGVIYVTGAVLFELPLGSWAERHGTDNFTYALLDGVEESLELIGVHLFILSLLDHLRDIGVTVSFGKIAATAASSLGAPR
jgi:hypothetical protein